MNETRLLVRLAESRADVLRCQRLIASIYNKEYQVVFSETSYDLEAKIEPWPHRYIMGLIDDELVCAAGLYTHSTYVERFGQITPAEFQAVIDDAAAAPRYDASRMVEYTKLVVREDMRGHGLGRPFIATCMSKSFLQAGSSEDQPAVLVMCAKVSIITHIFEPSGMRARRIKPFPIYRIHELYSSPADPMFSTMMIPELDLPHSYHIELPHTVVIAPRKEVALA